MTAFSISSRTVRLGFIVGLAFGSVNLLVGWVYPLIADTPATLLAFYGPMFVAWGLAAMQAVQRSGQLASGIATGIAIAFATFLAFDLLVMLCVNLFLTELAGRDDWQNLMVRFRASEIDNLRMFVNVEYLQQTPLKLVAFSTIGALIGMLGGALGQLRHGRIRRIST